MKTITKIQNAIARASLALSACGLVTIAAAVFIAVLCRFVLKTSSMWVEQYTRYMLIWVVFLASNVLVRHNELMRVDFLDGLWPKRFLKMREGCYTLLFIIILATLTWQGGRQAICYWQVPVVGLPVDKFWIYLSVPVGSLLMLVQYLLNLIAAFADKKGVEDTK